MRALLIFLIPFVAAADGFVVDAKTAKEVLFIQQVSAAKTTRIEISHDYLMKFFKQMTDGETKNLPIDGTADSLVLSRTSGHLDVVAIVDNIGTDIKIRKRISNFSSINSKGRVIVEKDSSSVINVIVIAGNVGTVIDINLNIDRRRTRVHDDDSDDEPKPIVPVAPRGMVYYVNQGQTLRVLGGYSTHDGRQWHVMAGGDTTVTFDRAGYIYAN